MIASRFALTPACGEAEAMRTSRKFANVRSNPQVAFVVDDVLPPWQPRGVEIRGRAEALGGPEPHIRIHPERIVGWGLDGTGRHARSVNRAG